MKLRQRKKAYKKKFGYNPNEKEKAQQLIDETIKHTNQCLAEVEQKRTGCTGFLKNIKRRSRSRWWRRGR